MRQFFKRFFNPETKLKRPCGFRPQLESMEERMVLSTTVGLVNQTLVITGDAKPNQVSITQDDAHNRIKVVADGRTYNYYSSKVTQLKVDLKAGDDNLSWTLAAGSNFNYAKTASIALGAGKDEAAFEFRGSRGSLLLSNLAIKTDAGQGDDVLWGNFGHKVGGKLDFIALMGTGNDEAHARLWGNVDKSANVSFSLYGQQGNDILSVWNTYNQDASAYYGINVAKGSAVNLYLDGGTGDDQMSITHHGKLDGKLSGLAYGRQGNDQIEADVLLTKPSYGVLDMALMGESGNDKLGFHLVNQAGRNVYVSRAMLDGGIGYDAIKYPFTMSNVWAAGIEAYYD